MEENASSSPTDRSFWVATGHPNRPEDLWKSALAKASSWAGEERGENLFRYVVHSMYNGNSHPTLDELFDWLDRNPSFAPLFESLATFQLPNDYFYFKSKTQSHAEDEDNDSQNQLYVEQHLEAVISGQHDIILGYLGELFLHSAPTHDKPAGLGHIDLKLGAKLAEAAETGMLAAIKRKDLPTPEQIGEDASKRKYSRICPALLAAAVLLHRRANLPRLDESPGLQSALAFEFVHPSLDDWFEEVLQRDPKGSARVITSAWEPRLREGFESIPHLHKGEMSPGLILVAKEVAIPLLTSCYRAKPEVLEQLMHMALAAFSKDEIAKPVSRVQLRRLAQEQKTVWLAFLLVLTPTTAFRRMRAYLAKNEIHRLRLYLEEFLEIDNHSASSMDATFLADLIRILGKECPPQGPPENGYTRLDPFVTVQFVERLINELGGRSDDDARSQLRALREDRNLAAWKDRLSYTIEEQRRKIREARFQRPSLIQTIQVLEGGRPQGLADLHAIVLDHIKTLAADIESGSTSGFLHFWNVEPKGAKVVPVEPVPENEARNRFASFLKVRLQPLGVSVDTEATYSNNNRADLKITFRSMSIPVEVKQHYNQRVWSAPREQLKEKYSIDPDSGGFGVYLVFWFGEAEGRKLPKLPNGISRPTTAAEMENALRQLYSGEEWRDTEFICIDCAPRPKN